MTGPISRLQRNPIGALPSSIAAVAGHLKVASLLDAGFRCRWFFRVENRGQAGKNQSDYQIKELAGHGYSSVELCVETAPLYRLAVSGGVQYQDGYDEHENHGLPESVFCRETVDGAP